MGVDGCAVTMHLLVGVQCVWVCTVCVYQCVHASLDQARKDHTSDFACSTPLTITHCDR